MRHAGGARTSLSGAFARAASHLGARERVRRRWLEGCVSCGGFGRGGVSSVNGAIFLSRRFASRRRLSRFKRLGRLSRAASALPLPPSRARPPCGTAPAAVRSRRTSPRTMRCRTCLSTLPNGAHRPALSLAAAAAPEALLTNPAPFTVLACPCGFARRACRLAHFCGTTFCAEQDGKPRREGQRPSCLRVRI